ncbi:helix-hairpin-helix domain-containing protein [Clostridium sp. YIM B02500]|uniref:ComEA family DNA-binding protein n=1 Tax=Clostridium sp. YIM B02500 TaxID=2910681 RepID=UPI001EEEDA80|nr:helix-hairpin-helix domain-containing protein [Clostridium sp. YIM B02500]
MKKVYIIIVLSILIMVIAFLLGFSVARSVSNININAITIGDSTTQHKKIDLNTADKAELMSKKGIGDKKADLIIKNRPYKSIWDLSNIDGISESFIQEIKEEITVD